MGCVYSRKRSKNWWAKYKGPDGKTVRRSTGTVDKSDAQRTMRKWEQEARDVRNGLVDPIQLQMAEHRRRPLGDHVRDYLEAKEREIREGTLREYRRHLDRFTAAFGNVGAAKTLAVCTADRTRAFMRWRIKDCGKSNADANRAFQAVRGWLSWLVDHDRLAVHPMRSVKALSERRHSDRRRIRREYTHEELNKLREAGRWVDRRWKPTKDGRYFQHPPLRYAQYTAAYFLGLRRGDLRRLTWDCVRFAADGRAGVVEIRDAKGGRTDTLPMDPEVEQVLREILPPMAMTSALAGVKVFPRVVKMEELRRDQLIGRALYVREAASPAERKRRRDSDFLCDSAIGVIDLHALRHTLATDLAVNNTAPPVVQALLRHRDIRTTNELYTHVREKKMADALAAMKRSIADGA